MHGSTLNFTQFPVNAGSRQGILGFLPAAPEWCSPKLCIGCFQLGFKILCTPLSYTRQRLLSPSLLFYMIIAQHILKVKKKLILCPNRLCRMWCQGVSIPQKCGKCNRHVHRHTFFRCNIVNKKLVFRQIK